MNIEDLYDIFFEVVNNIKKTAFSLDIIGPEFHLGGDLGIDSREMLEIWYDLEKKLDIEVPDSEKRDLYTVKDVVEVLKVKQGVAVV